VSSGVALPRALPGAGVVRVPLVAAALTGAAALLHLLGSEQLGEALAYRREAVTGGQPWRLLTGHLVHFGDAHAFGDILPCFVWAALVEGLFSRRLAAWTALWTALATGLVVLALCPEVGSYRGLSALNCAFGSQLLLLGMWDRTERRDRAGAALVALAAVAYIGKTLYENVSGVALLAPDLGPGVLLLPEAHLVGTAVGIVAAAPCLLAPGPTTAAIVLDRPHVVKHPQRGG